MLKSRLNDYGRVINGLQLVTNNYCKLKFDELNHFTRTSTNLRDLKDTLNKSNQENESCVVNSQKYLTKIGSKTSTLYYQTKIFLNSDYFTIKRQFRAYHTSNIRFNTKEYEDKLSRTAREQAVPVGRVSRLMTFGNLAAGLGVGAVSELAKRTFGLKDIKVNPNNGSVFISEENAQRIVNTLCKVRGAALKLGQMLSLQDDSLINPTLLKIFERVRQSADFMPLWQTEKALATDLGPNWKDLFERFDMKPFAAASIGQVHYAVLKENSQPVAVKIQYPGIDKSIKSDIQNLMTLMSVTNLLPKGLYVENLVEHVKDELFAECDYIQEAKNNKTFYELLKNDQVFVVPKVFDKISTKHVLITEFAQGVPLDKCEQLDQEKRNYVRLFLNQYLL